RPSPTTTTTTTPRPHLRHATCAPCTTTIFGALIHTQRDESRALVEKRPRLCFATSNAHSSRLAIDQRANRDLAVLGVKSTVKHFLARTIHRADLFSVHCVRSTCSLHACRPRRSSSDAPASRLLGSRSHAGLRFPRVR